MKVSELRSIVNPNDLVVHDNCGEISELCIDSRKVSHPEETLFFAIRTEKDDGHRYIPDLAALGVHAFVTEHPIENLQAIARAHRQQFDYPVVGITGSNGKTIVKEWLTALVDEDFRVVRSPDSYNSQIGVPLSVWRMSTQHTLAIFEAGVSQPGEMQKLADIIRPTLGILTNIGMAHAQFFQSEEQKIAEKLQLFTNCQQVIYHDDHEAVNAQLNSTAFRNVEKISWGSSKAVYPIENRRMSGGRTMVTLSGHTFSIPFIDSASVEDAIHAVVAALTLHCQPDAIQDRLDRLTRIGMRTEILEGRNHSVIINDTYSLDINSLNAALDFMDTQTQMPGKTLILSDFEQVGSMSEQDYRALNLQLKRHGITKLIAAGVHMSEQANCFDLPVQHFYPDTATLLANLPKIAFSYETILVKGARSFHFEQVVAELQHKTHLTILNVHLPALAYNLNYHRTFLKPETKMVAMVKASSYGLGDVELINELVYHHVDYLAVAYTDEGFRFRRRSITKPIIVLGAEAHSFEAMIAYRLEPEIFNFHYLEQLSELLSQHSDIESFPIHIKLDTGMHRLGFDEADLPRLVAFIQQHPKLKIASIFSHLAAAEDPNEDDFTRGQIALFDRMSSYLISQFDYPILRHILNSAGISRFPEAQYDMVRLGIGLYGFSAVPQDQAQLQNTVTLRTVVTQVKTIPANETIGYNRSNKTLKDSKIAIIPIGYADGYPRELGNGVGQVSIAGRLVPIVGKICMDMCMVDVTGLEVKEGDEVIVYGDANPLDKVAASIHRIPYELMTAISKRVQRIYIKE